MYTFNKFSTTTNLTADKIFQAAALITQAERLKRSAVLRDFKEPPQPEKYTCQIVDIGGVVPARAGQ